MSVPRTSIETESPTLTDGVTKAIATQCPSVGEKFPLLTKPTSDPAVSRTRVPSRAGRRPGMEIPTKRRDSPLSFSFSKAAFPKKSGLPHATTHSRPACKDVMPSPSSCPCSGNPDSRRRVSRAPKPAGIAPASRSAFQTTAAPS